MSSLDRFPRELQPAERELLLWVLPAGRSGYADYRKYIGQWPVAAVGRRGEGTFLLAEPGWNVDTDSPLPPVFAYGVVERRFGNLTVAVRERLGSQLEFELEGPIAATSEEIRRWSFSEWLPSHPCPACRSGVREIRMTTTTGQILFLVVCSRDRRIWVYDDSSGVNALIPVTGFYNELMLQTGIKDPKIALEPNHLFESSAKNSDVDLIRAFAAYNMRRNKVSQAGEIVILGQGRPGWKQRLFGSLRKH
jgi:hypothetical protein